MKETAAAEKFLLELIKLQAIKDSRDIDLATKREAKEKIYKERGEENAKQGRFYAEQIFDWAWNFTCSKLGQKVLSLMRCDAQGVKVVTFFKNSNYNGSLNIRGGGDGFLGYNGIDYRDEVVGIVIAGPESLAYRVDHQFLKKAWKEIEGNISGIYDAMISSLDRAI